MATVDSGILTFRDLDSGYYEDDPAYFADGELDGETIVKLTIPVKLMPGSGRYKVTIEIEPVELEPVESEPMEVDEDQSMLDDCETPAGGM